MTALLTDSRRTGRKPYKDSSCALHQRVQIVWVARQSGAVSATPCGSLWTWPAICTGWRHGVARFCACAIAVRESATAGHPALSIVLAMALLPATAIAHPRLFRLVSSSGSHRGPDRDTDRGCWFVVAQEGDAGSCHTGRGPLPVVELSHNAGRWMQARCESLAGRMGSSHRCHPAFSGKTDSRVETAGDVPR